MNEPAGTGRDTVAVIVPIYKDVFTENEFISLKQCLKVLNNYPIIFIGPAGLDIAAYKNVYGGDVSFRFRPFRQDYFNSIGGYNKLMLSAAFYKSFSNYKFILLYQLDAFVFKDELLYWCKQKYDYIGAPHPAHQNLVGEIQFLKNYSRLMHFLNKYLNTKHQVSNVGNGGFSLRNTQKCYWLLTILKNKAAKWAYNEDGFFKYWGNLFYPFFRLAPDETALKFSIETSPKESLQILNNKLPFGCHAFEKYGWETWKPYILKDD